MIDIISSIQSLLREAGYTAGLTESGKSAIVWFEDDAFAGFARAFDDPGSLLDGWMRLEGELLTEHSSRLRAMGEKSWNIYLVLISETSGTPELARAVCSIEEDLNRTRKITHCGVASRLDLKQALLPILPLQYEFTLRPEDIGERLRARIGTIAPAVADLMLDPSASNSEILRLLGGAK